MARRTKRDESALLRHATARVHHAQGALNFILELFGDHLAERESYRTHKGVEAVQFFLMTRHGWLPRDVRTMSHEELRFAMEEEMAGWTAPRETLGMYPDRPD